MQLPASMCATHTRRVPGAEQRLCRSPSKQRRSLRAHVQMHRSLGPMASHSKCHHAGSAHVLAVDRTMQRVRRRVCGRACLYSVSVLLSIVTCGACLYNLATACLFYKRLFLKHGCAPRATTKAWGVTGCGTSAAAALALAAALRAWRRARCLGCHYHYVIFIHLLVHSCMSCCCVSH